MFGGERNIGTNIPGAICEKSRTRFDEYRYLSIRCKKVPDIFGHIDSSKSYNINLLQT